MFLNIDSFDQKRALIGQNCATQIIQQIKSLESISTVYIFFSSAVLSIYIKHAYLLKIFLIRKKLHDKSAGFYHKLLFTLIRYLI